MKKALLPGLSDRVAFLPDVDAFQVIAQGVFYQTRSLHQNAESRIDDDDRLHINTDDVRLVVSADDVQQRRKYSSLDIGSVCERYFAPQEKVLKPAVHTDL